MREISDELHMELKRWFDHAVCDGRTVDVHLFLAAKKQFEPDPSSDQQAMIDEASGGCAMREDLSELHRLHAEAHLALAKDPNVKLLGKGIVRRRSTYFEPITTWQNWTPVTKWDAWEWLKVGEPETLADGKEAGL